MKATLNLLNQPRHISKESVYHNVFVISTTKQKKKLFRVNLFEHLTHEHLKTNIHQFMAEILRCIKKWSKMEFMKICEAFIPMLSYFTCIAKI